MLDSQTVLVTGGAGYIGSHTCKALAQAGFSPVVFDNLSNGHAHAVKWGPLVEGDLLDGSALDAAFAAHRPAAVLHFAAFIEVGESTREPTRYYRNNVMGSLNLVDAMRAHGAPPLVFSSTCAVYGLTQEKSLTEAHPLAPINPYGHSKRMVEQVLADADDSFAIRSVSLRYFNAAGADPDGEIGEEHDPETHLIPLVLQTVRGQRPAIHIFGTDYPTPDGTAIRDYIHVADLADAHVAALRYLQGGGTTTALNLGTGRGFSVREVIDSAARVTGRPVNTELSPRRPGDPPVLVAEPRRARETLAWEPRFRNLDDIVATAWAFHSGDDNVAPAATQAHPSAAAT